MNIIFKSLLFVFALMALTLMAPGFEREAQYAASHACSGQGCASWQFSASVMSFMYVYSLVVGMGILGGLFLQFYAKHLRRALTPPWLV